MIALSVIVPAWNEQDRIGPTVNALCRVLAASGKTWELLIVDDGSTDDTVARCRAMAARSSGIRVIATAPNRGKGHAVRVGMTLAQGSIRVMCDADGSMAASGLLALTEPIERGRAAVVIGSRHVPGGAAHARPLWRRAWSCLAHAVVQHHLVPGVADIHSGYKAFSAEAAQVLFGLATLDGWAFDLEVLALAKRLDFEILEVGIEWTDDRRSRVQPWRDFFTVVRETAALSWSLAHAR